MKRFHFSEPDGLADVIDLLARGDGGNCLMAGGSDLLPELKEGIIEPDNVVSLGAIEGMDRIERLRNGLSLGAMVTLAEMELGPSLSGPYRVLAEAARSVATPELRNQGTLGGNLCQRPRCLYFRSALTSCLKKGGGDCPAFDSPFQHYLSVMGGQGCFAVHPSDLAPPLLVLEARVSLTNPRGTRELALQDFFTGPETDVQRETCLAPDEVLTSVFVPAPAAGWRGAYHKGRERTAGDFAIVSCAAGFEMAEGRMKTCRLALGGVAPTPLRFQEAEAALEGQAPVEEVAHRAADVALAGGQPLAHNAFKLDLARALIVRTITGLAQERGG